MGADGGASRKDNNGRYNWPKTRATVWCLYAECNKQSYRSFKFDNRDFFLGSRHAKDV
jgi:hypothetical protein